ncbi:hypothetical protein, partial [Cupriavidus taiwanensis]
VISLSVGVVNAACLT